MLIRIPIASVIGGGLWFLETLLTYYADFFSVILAGIFGVSVSGLVALLTAVLFLPILLTHAWDRWRKFVWFPLFSLLAGVVFAIIARHPSMLQKAVDPEFGEITIYTGNVWFGIAAWLLIIVSIVVMPVGISPSKRWV